MRSLHFSGVPTRPLPKRHRVRLCLEELESRSLLSASSSVPQALISLTNVVVSANALPAIRVSVTITSPNLGNLNILTINLINANNGPAVFGNPNSAPPTPGSPNNPQPTNVNTSNEQLFVFSPGLSLNRFARNLAVAIAYAQNAEPPHVPPNPGLQDINPALTGLGLHRILVTRPQYWGCPIPFDDKEQSRLDQPIPGAEPPPALVPDAVFPAAPESLPDPGPDHDVEPNIMTQPIRANEEAVADKVMIEGVSRTAQVSETFFADRRELLNTTATATERALSARLQEEEKFVPESMVALIAVALVNSPCGAVETRSKPRRAWEDELA